MFEISGKYTTARVMIDDVEEECIAQIRTFVNHPAFTNPVAIMPDTHAGKGSVIGFTMPLGDKVIPNTIGVDVGCGITAVNIGDIDIDYATLDRSVRKAVPVGFNVHGHAVVNLKHGFDWKLVNEIGYRFRDRFAATYDTTIEPVKYTYEWFEKLCTFVRAEPDAVRAAVGTLGGGNHFIEVAEGEQGEKWVVVHSGSRNFGLRVAEAYQRLALKTVGKHREREYQDRLDAIRTTCERNRIGAEIKKMRDELGLGIPKDLAYLEGQQAHDYYHAMIFAQQYAALNRDTMIARILATIPDAMVVDRIESVHNFIDFDDLIIRKGAIRSHQDDRLIVPFNMRDGSLIGVGKGNVDWNCSAPHGAGRIMSRSVAKRTLSVEEYRDQMQGIYTTSVGRETLDEAPGAYKDAQTIIDAIAPSVEIVDRIRPVYNLKAST
ncbi:MAG: RtcB family protein [candidate division Zixibacteria bacterium]|nr:RtcB family protein [candidate division Zixibacteria bacterium]